jgi:phage terminase large subunit-like protein
MQHRKSVRELQLSGKWAKLSRVQQARRLLEEERGMPEGLSAAKRDRWHTEQSAVPASTPQLSPSVTPMFDASAEAKAYATDIVSGVIRAGKHHRLAAQRFLNDLGRPDLLFDNRCVQHVCEYVTIICGLKLLPWQFWVLANLFGFKRKDGLRRFRIVLIEIGKKNGKTELAAALSLYLADELGDGEPNARCYVAATSLFQSSVCFGAALRMRQNNPDLATRTRAFKASITWSHSSFEPLAANSQKLNGLNAHGVILDEIGDHPTPDLANTLISATVGRKQPMVVAISTAANVREQILFELRSNACQVLEGVIQRDDLFAMICELDSDDDYRNESVWVKTNPSIDILVPRENLRTLMASAESIPSTKRAFLRYHFNVWNSGSDSAWINFEDLEKIGIAYISDDEKSLSAHQRILNALRRLKGRPCVAGLDLAECDDESVLCVLFPPPNDGEAFEAVFNIWIPEEDIERRSREHRVPYATWRDQHFVTATKGNTTDFKKIRADILAVRPYFPIRELGFDRHLGADILQEVREDGLRVTAVNQGYYLSPAILRCEKLIKEGRLCIHGDPVATWNLSNCCITHGSQGGVQFNRERSREKIDAAVSLAIAMDIFMRRGNKWNPKKYEIEYF